MNLVEYVQAGPIFTTSAQRRRMRGILFFTTFLRGNSLLKLALPIKEECNRILVFCENWIRNAPNALPNAETPHATSKKEPRVLGYKHDDPKMFFLT